MSFAVLSARPHGYGLVGPAVVVGKGDLRPKSGGNRAKASAQDIPLWGWRSKTPMVRCTSLPKELIMQVTGTTTVSECNVGSPRGLTVRSLIPFFAWTFALSWGMGIAFVLFQSQVEALFGEMGYTNPVFIFMVYSPAIVGIAMVWRSYGLRGLGSFFRRFTLWRMAAKRWLVLLVGIPAVYYAGAAISGGLSEPFPFAPWYTVLPALLPMLFIGPLEEIGWRGVALPLLQRRFAPLWSALILGVTMAVWHTPSF